MSEDNAQQKQQAADKKRKAAGNGDDIQYFDTTVTKLVERENEQTGEKEWVEVMSDNLYPGERLKRDVEDERAQEATDKAAKKAKAEREKADK